MVNTKIRLIIFVADKDGEALYSQQKQADCGSDHELLIAKFRPKLKKVGETTIPFTATAAAKSLQSLSHV